MINLNYSKIGDLFSDIKIGGTPSRGNIGFFGGQNLWVSIRDMEGKSVINSTKERITDEGAINSNCKLVKKGSLLFSFKLTVGRVAFAGEDLYTNEAIAAFDSDDAAKAEIDLFYLSLVLPMEAIKDTTKNSMGASLLSKDRIYNLCIPHPSITIQRQIAAKLKAQLAEVETARKALQVQQADIKLFAATALDKLYSHPDKVKIGKVAKIQSGYAFKSKDFKTQGIKLLRNTNILPNRIYWDDMACLPSELITEYPNYVLNEGDVILSLDRPIISTGLKVARISNKDIPALLVQRVGRFLIDTNKLDPSYLYFFLNTSFFKDAISGHEQSLGVPHISPSQVENVDIPLPDVDEQKIIATKALEIFRQTNIAKIAAKEAQKDIDYLSSRLLAQAFDTQLIK